MSSCGVIFTRYFLFQFEAELLKMSSTNMWDLLVHGRDDVQLGKACGSTYQRGPEKEDPDIC